MVVTRTEPRNPRTSHRRVLSRDRRLHFLTPGTQHLKLTCQIVKLRILFHPGALQKHQEPETEHAHTHTHAHTHRTREQWVCCLPVHPWTDPVWLSPSLGAARRAVAPSVPGPAHTNCRELHISSNPTPPWTPHLPSDRDHLVSMYVTHQQTP